MKDLLNQLISTDSYNIPIIGFIVNLLIASAISLALGELYTRFGNSLSNRKLFSKNFMLITATTVLIISIVKTSLALSLGLVGALSIIRFRAAIKEPEELAYLFLAIAIGLGFGANQGGATIVAFMVISLIIIFKGMISSADEDYNMNLLILHENSSDLDINKIINLVKRNCKSVRLKRYDKTENSLNTAFSVEIKNHKKLIDLQTELNKLDKNIKITFLDNSGIID
jgi:hypothetical protein